MFQGVNGNGTRPLGKITLLITFGDQKNFRTETIIFDVTDTLLPYNSILGRPALAKFMAVSHFAYNMMKMPAPWGVLTVKARRRGCSPVCSEIKPRHCGDLRRPTRSIGG